MFEFCWTSQQIEEMYIQFCILLGLAHIPIHLPGYYVVFNADWKGQAVPEINVQTHHLNVSRWVYVLLLVGIMGNVE
jgi:hypothetical protein